MESPTSFGAGCICLSLHVQPYVTVVQVSMPVSLLVCTHDSVCLQKPLGELIERARARHAALTPFVSLEEALSDWRVDSPGALPAPDDTRGAATEPDQTDLAQKGGSRWPEAADAIGGGKGRVRWEAAVKPPPPGMAAPVNPLPKTSSGGPGPPAATHDGGLDRGRSSRPDSSPASAPAMGFGARGNLSGGAPQALSAPAAVPSRCARRGGSAVDGGLGSRSAPQQPSARWRKGIWDRGLWQKSKVVRVSCATGGMGRVRL
jgi:hypothetical protein